MERVHIGRGHGEGLEKIGLLETQIH